MLTIEEEKEYLKSLAEYNEIKDIEQTAFTDGTIRATRQIGRKMKSAGEPFEKIAAYTGLEIEEINKLIV